MKLKDLYNSLLVFHKHVKLISIDEKVYCLEDILAPLTEAANPNLVFEGYKHLSVVSFTDSELSLYSHSEDFISSKTVYYRNYLKNEIIGFRKVVRVLKKEDLIYLLLDRNVGFTNTESIDIKEAIDK